MTFTRNVAVLGGLSLGLLAAGTASPVAISPFLKLPRAQAACETLAGFTVAATGIGLPTSGATVTSAAIVAASPERTEGARTVLAIPEYCKVNGAIAPVDPAAPNINFQINLPTVWNRKTIQLGGSGFNGVIPVALTTGMQWGPESIPPNAPYALSRGFVVYGSDSGHQSGAPAGGGLPNAWALNPEALANFAYGQMKKTHDVMLAVVKAMYGDAPRRRYYMGSSQGGREALMVAQRFPQDYDGIFSQVPVLLQLQWDMLEPLLRVQAQAGDGWILPSKVPLVGKEVLRQCDALDGLADGLVSRYLACTAKFDPATAPQAWSTVRCEGGADTGDTCFSDTQIRALREIHGADVFPFEIPRGWESVPGWPTGGELGNNWKALGMRPTPASNAGMIRTLVTGRPDTDVITLNLADYRARVEELSALLDAGNPDLSAFQRRGGKLILKVNTTDYTANPRQSYAYYDKVVKTMGQGTVDGFMRFYVGVGIFHNRNIGRNPLTNEIVPAFVDFIGMLDNWVDQNKPPADAPVLIDMELVPPFAVKSSLPMCRYPRYPHYTGNGDPKSAASYTCQPN